MKKPNELKELIYTIFSIGMQVVEEDDKTVLKDFDTIKSISVLGKGIKGNSEKGLVLQIDTTDGDKIVEIGVTAKKGGRNAYDTIKELESYESLKSKYTLDKTPTSQEKQQQSFDKLPDSYKHQVDNQQVMDINTLAETMF